MLVMSQDMWQKQLLYSAKSTLISGFVIFISTQSEKVHTLQNYKARDEASHYEQNKQKLFKNSIRHLPSSSDMCHQNKNSKYLLIKNVQRN